jgi:hypothetical protein
MLHGPSEKFPVATVHAVEIPDRKRAIALLRRGWKASENLHGARKYAGSTARSPPGTP